MDKYDNLTRFAFATGTAVALLITFHIVQRMFERRHTVSGDAKGSNVAYLLLQAGHVIAVLLLVPGIVIEALTHHDTLRESATWGAVFVVVGVLLIHIAGALGVLLLLRSSLRAELERGNVAAGVAGAANYVAIGILAAKTIAGSDLRDVGLSMAFFGLAVGSLALWVVLFRALTAYDDAEQIRGENLTAAISYAGVTVAVAMLLARALRGGDFEGWMPALKGFASVAVLAFALYPVRQLVVQGLILGRMPSIRGGALDDAIGTERNVGMAAMESLTYIATASAISELL